MATAFSITRTAAAVTSANRRVASTRERRMAVKPRAAMITNDRRPVRPRFAAAARSATSVVANAAKSADDLVVDDEAGLLELVANDVDCIVMDCDGVLWQGDKLLPGVRESIQLLREMGKRLVFVTNNSNKSRRQYVHKFETLGITVEKEEVFSAAFAAAAYLKTQQLEGKAMVIGGQGIVDELNEMYIEVDPGVFNAVQCTETDWEELDIDPDCAAVIVGQDTSFTYAKLAYASLAIQRGAKFVATNPDAGDAIGPGLMPGAGAIVAAVEKACGVAPEIYAGKPSAFLLELLKGNHVDMTRTLVVGDRLDTDIAFGRAGGAGATVLTLTGVCGLEDVDAAMEDSEGGVIPDHIVQSLPHMLGLNPEDAAAIEFVEDEQEDDRQGDNTPERDDVDDYLDDEGFEDDDDMAFDSIDDQEARDAFGGRV
jgi:phosphoglycolate phosphatase